MQKAAKISVFILFAVVLGRTSFAEQQPPPVVKSPPATQPAKPPATPAATPPATPPAAQPVTKQTTPPAVQPQQQPQQNPVAKPVKAKAKPTLIVFNIVPERGVDQGLANLLTEMVLDAVSSTHNYTVIGQNELDKMTSWETNKQLRGCSDTACLVQIAGAMGASYYLEGSIGTMADLYVVTLKLIDAIEVKVLRRSTEKVAKNESALVNVAERMVGSVVSDKTAAASPAPKEAPAARVEKKAEAPGYPMNPYKLWGHASFWTGLGIAALGGVFTGLAASSADSYGRTLSGSDKSAVSTYNALAVTSYTLGGALLATGAVLWILSPGDEAWAKKHKLSVIPCMEPGSYGLAIGGGW